MAFDYRGHAIVEVLGKPKEHIAETVELVIKKLKEDNSYKISEIEKEEVVEVPDSILFSGVFEFEIQFRDFESVFAFIQEYLPSAIEFYEPEEIHADISLFNNIIADFIDRIHQYDKFTKEKITESMILQEKMDMLIRNLVLLALGDKKMDLISLSRKTGIDENSLKLFLNKFADEKIINEDNNMYSAYKPA